MPFASGHHRKVEAPSGIIRDGLQSRWPMDEGAGTLTADDQGSNPGTLTNMTPGDPWVPGIGIGPYSIDFLDAYGNPSINCGTLIPASPSAVTLCARIHPRNLATVIVIDNGNRAGHRIYRLSIQSASQVQILLGDNGGGWGLVWSASVAVPINTTSHLGFTWDGSTVRCYLNGIEGDNTPYVNTLVLTGTDFLVIGNLSVPSPSWKMQGIIDDARIYSRALSPAEMLQISEGNG